MNARQLPLALHLPDDATFANYFPGVNQEAYNYILQIVDNLIPESCMYLWGVAGAGKSHILQACCNRLLANNLAAFYLPLNKVDVKSIIASLQNLEHIALICLDDIEAIARNQAAEIALFHLFNRVKDKQQSKLLITAKHSPYNSNIQMPDLKSRLAGSVVYQLQPLGDADKLTALQLRARARGLVLDDVVGNFLLHRLPRNMAQLFDVLEQLDNASLAEQRRLTIPFIKQILGC